ncbi:MAG: hypothetical protein RQ728_05370 [Brevefilum sp.]|nr:hypothetical protein [Brevefilum sp.]MDT8381669.1 hypothetical protein [Brevefilum sp.]MDW7754739.1 hypothetical protein [Brevefilum sp.]
MKNKKSKTLMILALVSIFLFACPGCALTVTGFRTILGSFGTVEGFDSFFTYLIYGFRQGGWLICLGGILILVPIILGIIALVKNTQETKIEPLEPTGASKDDPIPPAS